jgi:hypothetical protein
MNINLCTYLIFNALLCATVIAQFPPSPENVTTIQSRFDDGITISYKEVCTVIVARDPPSAASLTFLLYSPACVRRRPESDRTPDM